MAGSGARAASAASSPAVASGSPPRT